MSIRFWNSWLVVFGVCVALAPESSPASNELSGATQPGLPPIPQTISPVDQFRKLLAMPEAEREKALAEKKQAVRERLGKKLAEYVALSGEEREARLRATELRYFLLPLLSCPRTNRPTSLDFVPETIRTLVVERLMRWDTLPPPLKNELLENQDAVRFLTQPGAESREAQERLLASMTSERRAELEAGIDRINSLPEDQRSRIFERFNKLFDLTPAERSRMLGRLSEAERQQMEKTLDAFGKLTPLQRHQCLAAFDKFAGMNLTERHQFLKNAEKWAAMTETERLRWRELVRKVPDWPPSPPIRGTPPPLPMITVKKAAVTIVTN